jgi:hypothetical protein
VPRPAAGRGQFDLPLALLKAPAVGIGMAADAARAGDALPESGCLAIRGRERVAAGTAEFRRADAQAVRHRHALVEDEALAFPEALLLAS